jgi:hypothetical protein
LESPFSAEDRSESPFKGRLLKVMILNSLLLKIQFLKRRKQTLKVM